MRQLFYQTLITFSFSQKENYVCDSENDDVFVVLFKCYILMKGTLGKDLRAIFEPQC